MINLNEIKVTPRDPQVLNLAVQGCSNKDIAGQLDINPRTVKQHLRTLFLRVEIRGRPQAGKTGRRHVLQGASKFMMPESASRQKKFMSTSLLWQESFAQHFRQLGVWRRLELAMCVASHGGKMWTPEPDRAGVESGDE